MNKDQENLLNIKKFILLLEGDKQISLQSYEKISQIISYFKNSSEFRLEIGYNNAFDEISARNFALSIQKFQNLQQFSFILRANNKLNEKGTEEIFTILGEQTQIEVIQIVIDEENQFTDKQFNLVCGCLQYLKKLEHLLIKIGGFSQLENKTEILGQQLKKISALKSFYLKIGQSSQFGQQGLASLGEGLSMHQNLKQLSIQFGRKNFENGQGYIDFGKNLQKISQLEKFSLILDDSNQLEGQQMVETFEAIGNQKNLKNLQIQISNNNEISKESGQQLGKSIKNLLQLEFLDIYIEKMNEQGKDTLSFIAGGLKDNQNLQILNLKFGKFNKIQDEGLNELSQNIQSCNNLKQITIQIGSNNELSGQSGVQLFYQIQSKLRMVEILNLNLQEVLQIRINKEKKTFISKIMKSINSESYNQFQLGINQFDKFEICFLTILQDNLTRENVQSLIDIFKAQKHLQKNKVVISNKGQISIWHYISLFNHILSQSDKIEKAELNIKNSFLGQFYRKEKSLAIVVQENQLCGQKGADQISQAIEGLKKMIQNFQLYISLGNKQTNETGLKIAKSILNCQNLVSVVFQIQSEQVRVQQNFDKFQKVINKCIKDREKIIQTYLSFFQKALEDYQSKQRGDFFNNICGFLPLMKDFSANALDQQQNQFGFGAGKKQINNNQPDLFETEKEFQDNFDDIEDF